MSACAVYYRVMSATIQHYYDGTSLRLSCSVTLDPSVDSNEIISVSWSGLSHIQQERYSVVHSTTSRSHSSSLTVSPLADKDDGTITCTGTVTGRTSAQSASSSDDIIINVKGMGNRKAFCMEISHSLPPALPSSAPASWAVVAVVVVLAVAVVIVVIIVSSTVIVRGREKTIIRKHKE